MKPLIRSGAVLRFSPVEDPLLGDVVLARYENGAFVAHRVVAMDDGRIWTKGDACRTPDEPFSRESVLACAVGLEEPFRLPLRGRFLRSAGLWLNRLYPLLIRAYRGLIPRKKRSC